MERFIEELERSFLERPHFLRTVLKVNGYDPDDDEDAIEDAIKNAFATTADVLMLTVGGEGPELTAIVDFDEDNWSERFNRPFHDIQNEIVDQSGGNIHVVDFKIFRTLNGGKYTLEVREKNCEFEIEDNVHNRSFSILNYDNGRYIHIFINRSVRARRLTTDARPINAIMEILAKFDSYEQITEIMWNDFSRLIGVSDAFFVLRDAAERKWAIDGKLPTFTDLAWAPGNERYDQAVLPRNAPVPATGDETCGQTFDLLTLDEFTPGDHIVHRKPGNDCFKKRTIDRIVQSGGTDPMTRESLEPWF